MTLFRHQEGQPPLQVGMRSDQGRGRDRNEDRCLVDLDRGLLAIADGMGGHPAGDVAAQVAVDRLPRLLDQALAEYDAGPAITQAIVALNEAVHTVAAAVPGRMGMGTTVVMLLVTDDAAYVAHVGDSRAYRLQREELHRLTEDHSFRTELIASGVIEPEEASTHPFAHHLTQAVGTPGDIEPTVQRLELLGGDRFLLCSDGLTDMVSEPDLGTLLARDPDPDSTCQTLVDAANSAGGRDNVSVIVADYPAPETP